MRDVGTW